MSKNKNKNGQDGEQPNIRAGAQRVDAGQEGSQESQQTSMESGPPAKSEESATSPEKSQETSSQQRQQPPSEKPKEAKAAKPKPAYEVAPGKALTTARGIVSAGQEVRARDFTRSGDEEVGAKQLRNLVAKGYVVDNRGR